LPDARDTAVAPAVSIGMPVYNAARHLHESLDSLLAQTFTDFEVIISDNASTDETAEIVREYAARDARFRYIRQDVNRGAAANFNAVVEPARGQYFKWHAHDDRLEPTYLARCVEVLDAGAPRVVLVFPQRVEIKEDGEYMGLDRKVRWFEAAPPYDRISLARSMLIPDRRYPELVFGLMPTDVLRRTGLIGAFHGADLVLVAELRLLGEFRHIAEPLFINRLHERRAVREEAAWYDPRRADRLRRPGWRLLRERLAAVARLDVGIGQKLWAFWCILILGHLVARTPPWIVRRWKDLMFGVYRAWERSTVGLLRAAGDSLWPQRLWMLAAGLRRLDGRQIGTALAFSRGKIEHTLAAFVAERLARRHDRDSAALLDEWSESNLEARRRSVAAVRGQRPAARPAHPNESATAHVAAVASLESPR
jgi:glycosyltransferase involved in cell wall biosynthesis